METRRSLVLEASKSQTWNGLLRTLRFEFWEPIIQESGLSFVLAKQLDQEVLQEQLVEMGMEEEHAMLIASATVESTGQVTTEAEAPSSTDLLMDAILSEIPLLAKDGLTPQERAAAVADTAYWRQLCPELHLTAPDDSTEEPPAPPPSVAELSPDLVAMCRERMLYDGYFDIQAAVLRWQVDIPAMGQAVKQISAAGTHSTKF